MRSVRHGASVELAFVVSATDLGPNNGVGVSRRFGRGLVRGAEAVPNRLGRIAARAGSVMAEQKIMIVFLQRIFFVWDISISPLGAAFTKDPSW